MTDPVLSRQDTRTVDAGEYDALIDLFVWVVDQHCDYGWLDLKHAARRELGGDAAEWIGKLAKGHTSRELFA